MRKTHGFAVPCLGSLEKENIYSFMPCADLRKMHCQVQKDNSGNIKKNFRFSSTPRFDCEKLSSLSAFG